MKKSKTILITGASGMLGRKLVEVLSQRFRVMRGRFDVTNAQVVVGMNEHVDAIIHCAAMTEVNKCELNKKACWDVNVRGTKHITDLARRQGANLIYISTPMVFSGQKGNYLETDRTRPQNYYARSKLAGEKIVLRYERGLVIRANPIGKRPSGSHPSFIQWFVQRARAHESFSLFSDVDINPISTTALARALERILRAFRPGILHIGSKDVVSKTDIWRLIVKKFPNYSGHVEKESVNATKIGEIAKRPLHMWLNVAKAGRFGIAAPSWRHEVELVLKELGL